MDIFIIWGVLITPLMFIATFLIYLWISKRTKLPPYCPLFSTSKFVDGTVIRLLYEMSQNTGLVYRIRTPFYIRHPLVVVTDGNLARKILEGDKSSGFLPGERTSRYKRLNKLLLGCNTVITKNTIGEGWEWARKAIAPEFSMANISKSIPKLHINLGKLEQIMQKHCEEGKPFDISKLMMQFTLDFILAALFKLNYDTMQNNDSIGNTLLREIEYAAREYGLKQYANIWRGYMFWDKEVIRAKNALKVIEAYIKNLIFEYKSSKTDDEIKTDDSLLGRLLRRCPNFSLVVIICLLLVHRL